jgi:hypothetical protein
MRQEDAARENTTRSARENAYTDLAFVQTLVENGEETMAGEVSRFTLKRRGGGWLLVLEALINGKKFVQFRDLLDLTEFPKAARALISTPKWKESKPFPIDKA